MLVVFITCPADATAERLARQLIEPGLAACVNIVPGLRSLYTWQGQLCDEPESLLIVKTTASRLPALQAAIKAQHPYQVAELLALPVLAGAPDYLAWVRGAVDSGAAASPADSAAHQRTSRAAVSAGASIGKPCS